MATKVQSVMFDKKSWDTDSARNWLYENDYVAPKVDITDRYLRFRQDKPENFRKKSFRTISFGNNTGIKAIIGTPMKKNPFWGDSDEADGSGHRIGAYAMLFEKARREYLAYKDAGLEDSTDAQLAKAEARKYWKLYQDERKSYKTVKERTGEKFKLHDYSSFTKAMNFDKKNPKSNDPREFLISIKENYRGIPFALSPEHAEALYNLLLAQSMYNALSIFDDDYLENGLDKSQTREMYRMFNVPMKFTKRNNPMKKHKNPIDAIIDGRVIADNLVGLRKKISKKSFAKAVETIVDIIEPVSVEFDIPVVIYEQSGRKNGINYELAIISSYMGFIGLLNMQGVGPLKLVYLNMTGEEIPAYDHEFIELYNEVVEEVNDQIKAESSYPVTYPQIRTLSEVNMDIVEESDELEEMFAQKQIDIDSLVIVSDQDLRKSEYDLFDAPEFDYQIGKFVKRTGKQRKRLSQSEIDALEQEAARQEHNDMYYMMTPRYNPDTREIDDGWHGFVIQFIERFLPEEYHFDSLDEIPNSVFDTPFKIKMRDKFNDDYYKGVYSPSLYRRLLGSASNQKNPHCHCVGKKKNPHCPTHGKKNPRRKKSKEIKSIDDLHTLLDRLQMNHLINSPNWRVDIKRYDRKFRNNRKVYDWFTEKEYSKNDIIKLMELFYAANPHCAGLSMRFNPAPKIHEFDEFMDHLDDGNVFVGRYVIYVQDGKTMRLEIGSESPTIVSPEVAFFSDLAGQAELVGKSDIDAFSDSYRALIRQAGKSKTKPGTNNEKLLGEAAAKDKFARFMNRMEMKDIEGIKRLFLDVAKELTKSDQKPFRELVSAHLGYKRIMAMNTLEKKALELIESQLIDEKPPKKTEAELSEDLAMNVYALFVDSMDRNDEGLLKEVWAEIEENQKDNIFATNMKAWISDYLLYSRKQSLKTLKKKSFEKLNSELIGEELEKVFGEEPEVEKVDQKTLVEVIENAYLSLNTAIQDEDQVALDTYVAQIDRNMLQLEELEKDGKGVKTSIASLKKMLKDSGYGTRAGKISTLHTAITKAIKKRMEKQTGEPVKVEPAPAQVPPGLDLAALIASADAIAAGLAKGEEGLKTLGNPQMHFAYPMSVRDHNHLYSENALYDFYVPNPSKKNARPSYAGAGVEVVSNGKTTLVDDDIYNWISGLTGYENFATYLQTINQILSLGIAQLNAAYEPLLSRLNKLGDKIRAVLVRYQVKEVPAVEKKVKELLSMGKTLAQIKKESKPKKNPRSRRNTSKRRRFY